MLDSSPKHELVASFYFVCVACNGKWFAAVEQTCCPRCDAIVDGERQDPPWLCDESRRTRDIPSIAVARVDA